MESVKCIIVGDKRVGKSELWSSFIANTSYDGPIPNVFDHPRSTVIVDGKPITLILLDDMSGDGYERLRLLAYSTAWFPEVRHYRPNIPIVLVGTKLDLRENESSMGGEKKITTVTYQQGLSMAKEMRAVKYVECSALTQKGLIKVFDEAARAALISLKKSNKLRSCLLA